MQLACEVAVIIGLWLFLITTKVTAVKEKIMWKGYRS